MSEQRKFYNTELRDMRSFAPLTETQSAIQITKSKTENLSRALDWKMFLIPPIP